MKEAEGEEESEQDWTCTWKVGELKQWSDPHIGATVQDRGKASEAESEAADLWQSEWNKNHTESPCHSHMYPRQGCRSPKKHSGWELTCRDWRAVPGQGLLLIVWRQPEGV